MKLKVLLPTEVLLVEEVSKVTAGGANGSFCLLPRHVDFVSVLVPGLLSYEDEAGKEHFLAVDEGVLVKAGSEVLVSVRRAVGDAPLETLQRRVKEQYEKVDEREQNTRTALARIEANFVRRFLEFAGS